MKRLGTINYGVIMGAIISLLAVTPASAQITRQKFFNTIVKVHDVASLPTCNATYKGAFATVTDSANAWTCSTGGGTVTTKCFCNGTNWLADQGFVLSDLGVAAGSGVAISAENSQGVFHKTVLSLTGTVVNVVDATTAGAHGGLKVFDFPEGVVFFMAATSDLAVVAGVGGISDTASVVGALGSVVVATDNATLTSTEADFLASTAVSLTAGAGAFDGDGALTAIFNGSATATDLYLNFAVPDADSTADDTLTVDGTITLLWASAGDN